MKSTYTSFRTLSIGLRTLCIPPALSMTNKYFTEHLSGSTFEEELTIITGGATVLLLEFLFLWLGKAANSIDLKLQINKRKKTIANLSNERDTSNLSEKLKKDINKEIEALNKEVIKLTSGGKF